LWLLWLLLWLLWLLLWLLLLLLWLWLWLLQAAKRGTDLLDKKLSGHAANAREDQPRTSVPQLSLRRSASPPGRDPLRSLSQMSPVLPLLPPRGPTTRCPLTELQKLTLYTGQTWMTFAC
jgi:hypothetical protein